MIKKIQKLTLLLGTFCLFSCNFNANGSSSKSQKEEISFERNSELGYEKFTFRFVDSKNFNGTQFSIIKKVDTVSSQIKGVVKDNGAISFTAENQDQSIEYLGKLEKNKLVLYTYEMNYTAAPLKKYTIKNPQAKLDSLQYNMVE